MPALLALSHAGECTGLAIDGYVKAAVSRWGAIVAALVDGPDLLEWPLDDQLSCIATGFHAPPYHSKRQEMTRSARRSRPPSVGGGTPHGVGNEYQSRSRHSCIGSKT